MVRALWGAEVAGLAARAAARGHPGNPGFSLSEADSERSLVLSHLHLVG